MFTRIPLEWTLVAVALLMLAISGCVTRGQEAKLGAEEAKKVEQTMGLLRDAKLEPYVRAIGEKLAAVSDLPGGPWHFMVVDVPDPNAFALPGGFIYVTRGLVTLVNSEDELAGVMGHEIAHVTARHSSKRIGAAVLTAPVAIATGIAGVAVSIVSPSLGNILAGTGPLLTGGLVIAPFSRKQENQADEIGQQLAARAGYDPAGISKFLPTLDREVTLLAGEERSFHFLDSHPMTPGRVEKTTRRAKELEPAAGRPVARNHSDFLGRIEGIVVGQDPAQGVFEEHRFMHPELDLALEFPVGWKTANTADVVGAVSPGQDALVALRMAENDSSLDATVAQMQKEQSDLHFERFEIRGLPAARTEVRSRGHYARITLIGYRGDVLAILGQSPESSAEQYAAVFDATTQSLRALRKSERAAIREARLRVRTARSGETSAGIAERTGSVWKAERIAVANAVEADGAFRQGQEVKVSIEQAYTPRSR
jgi:predicted Zn-dependent protease